MDRPPDPEEEHSSKGIPDLNVKSYYGDNIPAVLDDFGEYSFSEYSTSPESYNGDLSNLSEDSLDSRLINGEHFNETNNTFNDYFCGENNATRLISDILGNLGPNGAINDNILDTESDSDSDLLNDCRSVCDDSQCSSDNCKRKSPALSSPVDNSSVENSPVLNNPVLNSPAIVISSDDSESSSLTSSAPSEGSCRLCNNSEFIDSKLSLSSPSHLFSIPQVLLKFPPLNPHNYSYNAATAKWRLKSPLNVEMTRTEMTAEDLNRKREHSKFYLKRYPSDIVFPNVKADTDNYDADSDSEQSASEDSVYFEPNLFTECDDDVKSLCDELGSRKSLSCSLLHESSGNIPLAGCASPTGEPALPSQVDYNCDPNDFNAGIERLASKSSPLKKFPVHAMCYTDKDFTETVQGSSNGNSRDLCTTKNYLGSSTKNTLHTLDQRKITQNTVIDHNYFPSTSGIGSSVKTLKNSCPQVSPVEPSSNIISVGENVITCKNPSPYPINKYDDNCSPKDSNPNSVEEYKNITEDSQDEELTRHTTLASPEPQSSVASLEKEKHLNNIRPYKDSSTDSSWAPSIVTQNVESDIINDAALLYRLANSFDNVDHFNTRNNSGVNSPMSNSVSLDMPSLSPEPEILQCNYDRNTDQALIVPPTLTPQSPLLHSEKSYAPKISFAGELKSFNKEEKQKRKQNKDKINHMLPGQPLNKQLSKGSVILNDNNGKNQEPQVVGFDVYKFKPETDSTQSKSSTLYEKVDKSRSNHKPTRIPLKVSEEAKEDNIKIAKSDKSSAVSAPDIKKSEKKNQSVPKSFILGKVFPKNRVAKPDKSLTGGTPSVSSIEHKETDLLVPLKNNENCSDNIKPVSKVKVSYEGEDLMKISNKKRLLVSLARNKNSLGSRHKSIKYKSSPHLVSSKAPLCPSLCSRDHKLAYYKRYPPLLNKRNKKKISMMSRITKARLRGYNFNEKISEKFETNSEEDVRNDISSFQKTKDVSSACNNVSDVEKTSFQGNKSRPDNLEKETNNSEVGSKVEKSLYVPMIRHKLESVVAEADSTGWDPTLLDDDIILNNVPNLIIEKDGACSKIGVSNEIRLKQSDSVRLLLEPGNLSRDNRYTSMVITVATAEISCINDPPPHSVMKNISANSSASEKYSSDKKDHIRVNMEYMTDSNKDESPQGTSSAILKKDIHFNGDMKNGRQSENKIKSDEDTNDFVSLSDGHALKHSQSKQNQENGKLEIAQKSSSSISQNSEENAGNSTKCSVTLKDKDKDIYCKDADSVSSTSNGDGGSRKSLHKTKDERKHKSNGDKESREKSDEILERVSNLRKRSSSCGSTERRGRRNSSENNKKGVCEIVCRIDLSSIRDQIRSKTLSLSDTCVSSICDKDSTKRIKDSLLKHILNSESPASNAENNESIEVSSSTSPGKDDKYDRLNDLAIPNVDVSLIREEAQVEKNVSKRTSGTSKSSSSKARSKSSDKKISELNQLSKTDSATEPSDSNVTVPSSSSKNSSSGKGKSEASKKSKANSSEESSTKGSSQTDKTSKKINSNSSKKSSGSSLPDDVKSKSSSDLSLKSNKDLKSSKGSENENTALKKHLGSSFKSKLKKGKSEAIVDLTKVSDLALLTKPAEDEKPKETIQKASKPKPKELLIDKNVKSDTPKKSEVSNSKKYSSSTRKDKGKVISDEPKKTENEVPNKRSGSQTKRDAKSKDYEMSSKRTLRSNSSSSETLNELYKSKDSPIRLPFSSKDIKNESIKSDKSFKDSDSCKKSSKNSGSTKISEKDVIGLTKTEKHPLVTLEVSKDINDDNNKNNSRSRKGRKASECDVKTEESSDNNGNRIRRRSQTKSQDKSQVDSVIHAEKRKPEKVKVVETQSKAVKSISTQAVKSSDVTLSSEFDCEGIDNASNTINKMKGSKIKTKTTKSDTDKSNLSHSVEENTENFVKNKLRSTNKLQQDLDVETLQKTHVKTKAALKEFEKKQNESKTYSRVSVDKATKNSSEFNQVDDSSKSEPTTKPPSVKSELKSSNRTLSSENLFNLPKKKSKLDKSNKSNRKNTTDSTNNFNEEKSVDNSIKNLKSKTQQALDVDLGVERRSLRKYKKIIDNSKHLDDDKMSKMTFERKAYNCDDSKTVVSNLDKSSSKHYKDESEVTEVFTAYSESEEQKSETADIKTSSAELSSPSKRERCKSLANLTCHSNYNMSSETLLEEPAARKEKKLNITSNLGRLLRSKSSPPTSPDKESGRQYNLRPSTSVKSLLSGSSTDSLNTSDRKLRSSANWSSSDPLPSSPICNEVQDSSANTSVNTSSYNVRSSRRIKSMSESCELSPKCGFVEEVKNIKIKRSSSCKVVKNKSPVSTKTRKILFDSEKTEGENIKSPVSVVTRKKSMDVEKLEVSNLNLSFTSSSKGENIKSSVSVRSRKKSMDIDKLEVTNLNSSSTSSFKGENIKSPVSVKTQEKSMDVEKIESTNSILNSSDSCRDEKMSPNLNKSQNKWFDSCKVKVDETTLLDDSYPNPVSDVSEIPLPKSPVTSRRSSLRSNKYDSDLSINNSIKFDVSEIPLPKSPPSRRSLRCLERGPYYHVDKDLQTALCLSLSSVNEKKIAYKNFTEDTGCITENGNSLRTSAKDIDSVKESPNIDLSRSLKSPVKEISIPKSSSKLYPKNDLKTVNVPVTEGDSNNSDSIKHQQLQSDSISKDTVSNMSVESPTCERRSARLQEKMFLCYSSPLSPPLKGNDNDVNENLHSNKGDDNTKKNSDHQDPSTELEILSLAPKAAQLSNKQSTVDLQSSEIKSSMDLLSSEVSSPSMVHGVKKDIKDQRMGKADVNKKVDLGRSNSTESLDTKNENTDGHVNFDSNDKNTDDKSKDSQTLSKTSVKHTGHDSSSKSELESSIASTQTITRSSLRSSNKDCSQSESKFDEPVVDVKSELERAKLNAGGKLKSQSDNSEVGKLIKNKLETTDLETNSDLNVSKLEISLTLPDQFKDCKADIGSTFKAKMSDIPSGESVVNSEPMPISESDTKDNSRDVDSHGPQNICDKSSSTPSTIASKSNKKSRSDVSDLMKIKFPTCSDNVNPGQNTSITDTSSKKTPKPTDTPSQLSKYHNARSNDKKTSFTSKGSSVNCKKVNPEFVKKRVTRSSRNKIANLKSTAIASQGKTEDSLISRADSFPSVKDGVASDLSTVNEAVVPVRELTEPLSISDSLVDISVKTKSSTLTNSLTSPSSSSPPVPSTEEYKEKSICLNNENISVDVVHQVDDSSIHQVDDSVVPKVDDSVVHQVDSLVHQVDDSVVHQVDDSVVHQVDDSNRKEKETDTQVVNSSSVAIAGSECYLGTDEIMESTPSNDEVECDGNVPPTEIETSKINAENKSNYDGTSYPSLNIGQDTVNASELLLSLNPSIIDICDEKQESEFESITKPDLDCGSLITLENQSVKELLENAKNPFNSDLQSDIPISSFIANEMGHSSDEYDVYLRNTSDPAVISVGPAQCQADADASAEGADLNPQYEAIIANTGNYALISPPGHPVLDSTTIQRNESFAESSFRSMENVSNYSGAPVVDNIVDVVQDHRTVNQNVTVYSASSEADEGTSGCSELEKSQNSDDRCPPNNAITVYNYNRNLENKNENVVVPLSGTDTVSSITVDELPLNDSKHEKSVVTLNNFSVYDRLSELNSTLQRQEIESGGHGMDSFSMQRNDKTSNNIYNNDATESSNNLIYGSALLLLDSTEDEMASSINVSNKIDSVSSTASCGVNKETTCCEPNDLDIPNIQPFHSYNDSLNAEASVNLPPFMANLPPEYISYDQDNATIPNAYNNNYNFSANQRCVFTDSANTIANVVDGNVESTHSKISTSTGKTNSDDLTNRNQVSVLTSAGQISSDAGDIVSVNPQYFLGTPLVAVTQDKIGLKSVDHSEVETTLECNIQPGVPTRQNILHESVINSEKADIELLDDNDFESTEGTTMYTLKQDYPGICHEELHGQSYNAELSENISAEDNFSNLSTIGSCDLASINDFDQPSISKQRDILRNEDELLSESGVISAENSISSTEVKTYLSVITDSLQNIKNIEHEELCREILCKNALGEKSIIQDDNAVVLNCEAPSLFLEANPDAQAFEQSHISSANSNILKPQEPVFIETTSLVEKVEGNVSTESACVGAGSPKENQLSTNIEGVDYGKILSDQVEHSENDAKSSVNIKCNRYLEIDNTFVIDDKLSLENVTTHEVQKLIDESSLAFANRNECTRIFYDKEEPTSDCELGHVDKLKSTENTEGKGEDVPQGQLTDNETSSDLIEQSHSITELKTVVDRQVCSDSSVDCSNISCFDKPGNLEKSDIKLTETPVCAALKESTENLSKSHLLNPCGDTVETIVLSNTGSNSFEHRLANEVVINTSVSDSAEGQRVDIISETCKGTKNRSGASNKKLNRRNVKNKTGKKASTKKLNPKVLQHSIEDSADESIKLNTVLTKEEQTSKKRNSQNKNGRKCVVKKRSIKDIKLSGKNKDIELPQIGDLQLTNEKRTSNRIQNQRNIQNKRVRKPQAKSKNTKDIIISGKKQDVECIDEHQKRTSRRKSKSQIANVNSIDTDLSKLSVKQLELLELTDNINFKLFGKYVYPDVSSITRKIKEKSRSGISSRLSKTTRKRRGVKKSLGTVTHIDLTNDSNSDSSRPEVSSTENVDDTSQMSKNSSSKDVKDISDSINLLDITLEPNSVPIKVNRKRTDPENLSSHTSKACEISKDTSDEVNLVDITPEHNSVSCEANENSTRTENVLDISQESETPSKDIKDSLSSVSTLVTLHDSKTSSKFVEEPSNTELVLDTSYTCNSSTEQNVDSPDSSFGSKICCDRIEDPSVSSSKEVPSSSNVPYSSINQVNDCLSNIDTVDSSLVSSDTSEDIHESSSIVEYVEVSIICKSSSNQVILNANNVEAISLTSKISNDDDIEDLKNTVGCVRNISQESNSIPDNLVEVSKEVSNELETTSGKNNEESSTKEEMVETSNICNSSINIQEQDSLNTSDMLEASDITKYNKDDVEDPSSTVFVEDSSLECSAASSKNVIVPLKTVEIVETSQICNPSSSEPSKDSLNAVNEVDTLNVFTFSIDQSKDSLNTVNHDASVELDISSSKDPSDTSNTIEILPINTSSSDEVKHSPHTVNVIDNPVEGSSSEIITDSSISSNRQESLDEVEMVNDSPSPVNRLDNLQISNTFCSNLVEDTTTNVNAVDSSHVSKTLISSGENQNDPISTVEMSHEGNASSNQQVEISSNTINTITTSDVNNFPFSIQGDDFSSTVDKVDSSLVPTTVSEDVLESPNLVDTVDISESNVCNSCSSDQVDNSQSTKNMVISSVDIANVSSESPSRSDPVNIIDSSQVTDPSCTDQLRNSPSCLSTDNSLNVNESEGPSNTEEMKNTNTCFVSDSSTKVVEESSKTLKMLETSQISTTLSSNEVETPSNLVEMLDSSNEAKSSTDDVKESTCRVETVVDETKSVSVENSVSIDEPLEKVDDSSVDVNTVCSPVKDSLNTTNDMKTNVNFNSSFNIMSPRELNHSNNSFAFRDVLIDETEIPRNLIVLDASDDFKSSRGDSCVNDQKTRVENKVDVSNSTLERLSDTSSAEIMETKLEQGNSSDTVETNQKVSDIEEASTEVLVEKSDCMHHNEQEDNISNISIQKSSDSSNGNSLLDNNTQNVNINPADETADPVKNESITSDQTPVLNYDSVNQVLGKPPPELSLKGTATEDEICNSKIDNSTTLDEVESQSYEEVKIAAGHIGNISNDFSVTAESEKLIVPSSDILSNQSTDPISESQNNELSQSDNQTTECLSSNQHQTKCEAADNFSVNSNDDVNTETIMQIDQEMKSCDTSDETPKELSLSVDISSETDGVVIENNTLTNTATDKVETENIPSTDTAVTDDSSTDKELIITDTVTDKVGTENIPSTDTAATDNSSTDKELIITDTVTDKVGTENIPSTDTAVTDNSSTDQELIITDTVTDEVMIENIPSTDNASKDNTSTDELIITDTVNDEVVIENIPSTDSIIENNSSIETENDSSPIVVIEENIPSTDTAIKDNTSTDKELIITDEVVIENIPSTDSVIESNTSLQNENDSSPIVVIEENIPSIDTVIKDNTSTDKELIITDTVTDEVVIENIPSTDSVIESNTSLQTENDSSPIVVIEENIPSIDTVIKDNTSTDKELIITDTVTDEVVIENIPSTDSVIENNTSIETENDSSPIVVIEEVLIDGNNSISTVTDEVAIENDTSTDGIEIENNTSTDTVQDEMVIENYRTETESDKMMINPGTITDQVVIESNPSIEIVSDKVEIENYTSTEEEFIENVTTVTEKISIENDSVTDKEVVETNNLIKPAEDLTEKLELKLTKVDETASKVHSQDENVLSTGGEYQCVEIEAEEIKSIKENPEKGLIKSEMLQEGASEIRTTVNVATGELVEDAVSENCKISQQETIPTSNPKTSDLTKLLEMPLDNNIVDAFNDDVIASSPLSSPSEDLPISPLTAYNTSYETDSSPSAKDINSPLSKIVPSPLSTTHVISKNVPIEGDVISPVENSDNKSVEDINSKTLPVESVVVSPGEITSLNISGNDDSIATSQDVLSTTSKDNKMIDLGSSQNNESSKPLTPEEQPKCSSSSAKSDHNTCTEEEILNSLMSSVVCSVEVENSFTEGSESENSPKNENPTYLSENVQLSPHSLEAANYRKRKIKALRETDFVKKSKHYYKSGNIIIHSSEEECGHEREGSSVNSTLTRSHRIQNFQVKSGRLLKPCSKAMQLKKRQVNKNSNDSEISSSRVTRSTKEVVTDLSESSGSKDFRDYNVNLDKSIVGIELCERDNAKIVKESDELVSSTFVKDNESKTIENDLSIMNVDVDNSVTQASSYKVDPVGKRPAFLDSMNTDLKKSYSFVRLHSRQKLVRSRSLDLMPEPKLKRRSDSLDSYFFCKQFHDFSDFSKPVQTMSSLKAVSLENDRLTVSEEGLQSQNTVENENMNLSPVKEVRVVLERINLATYYAAKELKLSDVSSVPVKSNISSRSRIRGKLGKKIVRRDSKAQDINDPQSHSSLKEMHSVSEELQDQISQSNGSNESGKSSSVNSKLVVHGEDSNGSLGCNSAGSEQQSSSKSTSTGPPSSSRPASPDPKSEIGKKDCFININRLTMNNLRSVMQSNSLTSVNVPACFLHFKEDSDKFKNRVPKQDHFVQILDEGAYFKVVSLVDTFEVFFLDNSELRHHHLNIDPCKCPFPRKLKHLRGWSLFKKELEKDQARVTTNKTPKRPGRPVGRKKQPTSRNKLMNKLLHDRSVQTSSSNAAERVEDNERMWSCSERTDSEDRRSEAALVGKVRSMEMPLLDETPGYVCHQPFNNTSDLRTGVEPLSPSMFPVNIPPLRTPVCDPSESINFDIFSVKGMIKERKGGVSNTKNFNFNPFCSEANLHSVRGNDALITNDCFIQPDLLNEDFSPSPLFSYNAFMKPRSKETEKPSNVSGSLNSYPEAPTAQTVNYMDERSMSELERTLRLDKRRLEPDLTERKRPRLDERSPRENLVSVSRPLEIPAKRVELPNTSRVHHSTIRLKDKALLMAPEKEPLCQENPGTSRVQSLPHDLVWSRRMQRREKKVSKRREVFLKEKSEREEQMSGFRRLSSSKIMGVALNDYPSYHVTDMNRTINLNILQQMQRNTNRMLCITKEGATNTPINVFDDRAEIAPNPILVRRKTLAERMQVERSLTRFHQQHNVFTTSVPPSVHKTDQVIIEGERETDSSDSTSSDSSSLETLKGHTPRIHLMRHNWSQLNPEPVDVFDPDTIDTDSLTETGDSVYTDDTSVSPNSSPPHHHDI